MGFLKWLGVTFIYILLLNTSSVHCFVNGLGATLGQFPFVVLLHLPQNQHCAGSVINHNHILTAASCILNAQHELIAPQAVTVRLGAVNIVPAVPTLNVLAIFPHQLYNPHTFENDIAVLRVNNLTFVTDIALPPLAPGEFNERATSDGISCQLVGWTVGTGAIPPITQQFMNVLMVNRDTCNTNALIFGQPSFRVEESMTCGTAPIDAGVCLTSRGGPLICNNRIIGVLSNGFGCTTFNQGSSYTQSRMYSQWISLQLNRTDIPLAGPTPAPGIPVPGAGASSLLAPISWILIVVAILAS